MHIRRPAFLLIGFILAMICAVFAGAFASKGIANAQERMDLAVDMGTEFTGGGYIPVVTVSNLYEGAVSNVEVVIEIAEPPGFHFTSVVAAPPIGSATKAPGGDSRKVLWSIPILPGLSEHHYRVRGSVDDESVTLDGDPPPVLVKYIATVSSDLSESGPSLLNNRDEIWMVKYYDIYAKYEPVNPYYSLIGSVDNRAPQPGDTVTFTVIMDAGSRYRNTLSDVQVAVTLTPELTPGAASTRRSDGAADTSTYTATTSGGTWNIGTHDGPEFIDNGYHGKPYYELTLPATLGSTAASAEGQCLTAEVTALPPTGVGEAYDDPADNRVQICLGDNEPTLFREGEIALLSLYDCVNESTMTDYSCANDSNLELLINSRGIADPWLEPEDVLIQVQDKSATRHEGVWRSGSISTEGKKPAGLIPGVATSWSVPGAPNWNQHTFSVSDAGAKPGTFRMANARSTSFTVFDIDNKPSLPPIDLPSSLLEFDLLFEFGALGTYVVDITLGATDTTTSTAYSDTKTYTFHVGPVADLEVRDGAPNPQLGPGQTAFTIMAVNNGPEASPGAEVMVYHPDKNPGLSPEDYDTPGLDASHYTSIIASHGTFDPATGVWDIGELLYTDSYPPHTGQAGPTLVIITDAANSSELTATIANTENYSVVIDDDPNTDDTHTGPVLDHISRNNMGTISAAAGSRPAPTGLTVTPQSHTSVLLAWDALPEFLGSDTTHYEIEYLADEDGAQWTKLVANTESYDGGDREGTETLETEYLHFTGLSGHSPQYRVSAWNTAGKRSASSDAATASLPIVAAYMVPEATTPPGANIRSVYHTPVKGEPVRANLSDENNYLARIGSTPSTRSQDPCIGWVPRPDTSVPDWVWQSSSDYTDDGNDSNDTWTDIPNDGRASYVYIPVAGDVGKHLRARLTFGTPPVTATTAAFGPVLSAAPAAVSVTGAVSLHGTGQVGAPMVAELDISGANIVHRWQWERSADYTDDGNDSNDTWVNVTRYGSCLAVQERPNEYTPSVEEKGSHFRAYAYYNDGDGNLRRGQTGVVGPNVKGQGSQGRQPRGSEPPVVSISAIDSNVAEGTDSAVSATVSLSVPSAETVTVDWQTTDGTAYAGEDYTDAAGRLTFAPGGALTQKVSVAILDDTEHEASPETFYIDLSKASNATIDPNNDRITVTITSDDAAPKTNSPPVFDAGTSAFSVAENATEVGTVTATDPNGDSVDFALNGGADEAKFAITLSGALTFVTAPDHEQPADSDGDNRYEVMVRASDGSLTTDQLVIVTVADSAETDATLKALFLADQDGNPVAIGNFDPSTTAYAASVGIEVSSVAVTTTPNHPDATAAVSGGTGLAEGENTVIITVTAEDGSSHRDYTITVSRAAAELPDMPDSPPAFDAGTSAFSVAENATAVGTVTATDPNGDSVDFALNGGADEAKFAITSAGVLTFVTAPDHEQPADSDGDNHYEVVVRASDGSLTTDQTVTVTVTDAAETDTTVKALSLADQDGNPVSIGDFATTTAIAISVGNEVTSVAVTATPNHPDATVAVTGGTGLAEGENTIAITVTAEDGNTHQDYTITVSRAAAELPNNPPVFDAGTSAFTVAENAIEVGTVTATDPDDGDSVDFALNGGADEGVFAITMAGALTFVTAPDHEQPTDSGGDNIYEVVVQASDGSLATDQSVTVRVTDAAETDAALKALSLSDQDGNPVDIGTFADITAYAADVGNEVTSVAVTATPNHPDATVAVIGGTGLAEGENIITITVTAEDGSTHQDYTITVSRAAAEQSNNPPTDNEKPGTVRNLSVSVGTGSLTISWEAPDTGGTASGYDVDYDLTSSAVGWVTAQDNGDATSVTVTGLAPGEYRIRVRATNSYGSSKWSRDRVTVAP